MTNTAQHIITHNVFLGIKEGHYPTPCDPGCGGMVHTVTVARRGNHPF